MLENVYKSYRQLADSVNWQSYNVNDLFREYIINENNDDLRDAFFSAIVCRFWGYAGRIYVQCNKHISFEECHDCIVDAIRYVLKKRVWENKDSSLYNDPLGPDKAMHIAMKRQKGIMLAQKSTAKRQSNFNTLSIDEMHESYNDSADGLMFELESSEGNDGIKRFINDYFDRGEYLNGLFLDAICYLIDISDYSEKKVLKSIKSLKNEDLYYYINNYNADRHLLVKTINEFNRTDSDLLKMKLKSLLYTLKKDGEIWQH